MSISLTRRDFLTGALLGGVGGCLHPRLVFAAEAPPETTSVRLTKFPGICLTPQYVAEGLLRSEGFTDIRYAVVDKRHSSLSAAVAENQADFTQDFAARSIRVLDAGGPIKVLSGVHTGCFELIAHRHIRTVADLKGKSVGVNLLGEPIEFLTAMAANIGINPAKEINWVTGPSPDPMELFAEGKIDAFLGTPPEPQQLRDRHVGHVIVSSAVDSPWAQYLCCVLAGRSDYVRRYPSATKRVLRAILKAADLCVSQPRLVAQRLAAAGFVDRQDVALQTLSDVPYDRWRDYDPEDTLRFYALRLREAGMITATPQQIIARGADWRFLNELKRELKA